MLVFVTHIFIDMKRKKTKHLSIRLTNQQYQRLVEVLKQEKITKSELVRLALTDYISND